MDRLKYLLNVVIIAIFFVVVAIQRDGRVGGVDVVSIGREVVEEAQPLVEWVEEDGTRVINSTSLAKDIVGYAGTTPVNLYIKDGVVSRVEFLPNVETPSFFRHLEWEGLGDRWVGMTLEEAAHAEVDGVSGSTMSSLAVVANVRRAAQYGASVEAVSRSPFADVDPKAIVALLVLLLGVVITLLKVKSRVVMVLQMVLNVGVLGFWCGSFLSLSSFTAWAANGFNWIVAIVPISMLAIVVIMPLLGRKGSYCHLHCPMGSAQELMAMVPLTKLKLNPTMVKYLQRLRYYILAALLFLMWIGVGFELMDYEVFSAFLLGSASTFVLVLAAIFLLLSMLITRPYCRFICPTGALLTVANRVDK